MDASGERCGGEIARTRSGDVPSALATRGDAASGFVGVVFVVVVRFFFLVRGNARVAPARAAGSRGS